jgi:predicted amino acid racemase
MKRRPALIVDHAKLRSNMKTVVDWCADAGIDVAGVIKGANGMASVARDYEASGARWIASSRMEQLVRARDCGVDLPMMMIRVPMLSEVPELVRVCDYSLQSEYAVLKATDDEAIRQGKIHNVILMADLGDLREGYFDKDELIAVAKYTEDVLTGLHLAGIGTNLGCYGSVKPTEDKMKQLVSYAEAIEAEIGRPLEIISGGASSSIMPVFDNVMPKRVNMLRIGELALCGALVYIRTCYDRTEADVMYDDAFTLEAEVVEVRTKPTYPIGELGVDASAHEAVYVDRGDRKRVLLAIGRADYGNIDDIIPMVSGAEVLGASGDHTILDTEDCDQIFKPGDIVRFKLRYTAIIYLTSSENVTIYEENLK